MGIILRQTSVNIHSINKIPAEFVVYLCKPKAENR